MKELRKRFDAKEHPSAMRHQLLDARQELGTRFQSGVTGDFVWGCPFDGSLSANGGQSPSWKTFPAEAESHTAPPLVQDLPGQPSVHVSTEQLKVGAKQIGLTVPGLPSLTVFGGRLFMSLSPDVERSRPSSWQWRVTSLGGGTSLLALSLSSVSS